MLQFPKLHTKSVHCPMNKKRKKQRLKFRFKAQKRPVYAAMKLLIIFLLIRAQNYQNERQICIQFGKKK